MSMKSSDFKERKYKDGRTKQSFKDSTDINKILQKAQREGTTAHLDKYPAEVYGEFQGDVDLLTAQSRIARANEIFTELPSEIRREFDNNALKFVTFAGNPENNDKLDKILPAIAKPDRYFPNPVNQGGQGAGAATQPTNAPKTPQDQGSGENAPSEPSE